MTHPNQVLQIALDTNGNAVSIYKVPTGLACKCFCPVCKEPLEAKNKNKTSNEAILPGQKIAHFAHNDGSICAGAVESAIHQFAKEVLLRTKKLTLPPLFVNEIQVSKPVPLVFDKVEIEKNVDYEGGFIRPDAICYYKNRKLFVEFYKTHSIDEDKKRKIAIIGTSTIEINVNFIDPLVDGELNDEEMIGLFEKDVYEKEWIFSSESDKLYERELNKRRVEEENQKKVKAQMKEEEKQKLEYRALSREQFRKGRLDKGYEMRKIYVYERFDRESSYNAHTERSRSYKMRMPDDKKVYCPKDKVNGKNARIDLTDCECCEFFGGIVFGDLYNEIACGLKNNLLTI